MKNVVVIGCGTPFYIFGRAVLALLVSVPLHLHAEGAEHVPAEGPVLLAVTHKSDFDPVLVGTSLRRMSWYFAKAELFRNRFLGAAISRLGAIPVRRGESDRHALENALAILAAGRALLIFPEGTRFHDHEIHPFQPGVGMLALRSGATVVPVAVWNSDTASFSHPRQRPRVQVRFGPPVDLAGLEGRRSAVYAEAALRIETRVRELYEGLKAEDDG